MKNSMHTMKTALFVVLTALTLTACAHDDKAQADAPTKATAKTAADKPVLRKGHRMQLDPVAADKFTLARKD